MIGMLLSPGLLSLSGFPGGGPKGAEIISLLPLTLTTVAGGTPVEPIG